MSGLAAGEARVNNGDKKPKGAMLTRPPMTLSFLAVMVVAAGLIGCSRIPAPAVADAQRPTVAAIAAEYPSYRKMTDADVFVNPELAMLCIGASQEHVEAARKTKGPHAHSAIRVYMNDSAAKAFATGGAYAPGSVIVKQKRLLSTRSGRSSEPGRAAENGAGGMVKRSPGFDPAHGDWEYFYFDDAARIESGRMTSCIACHETAKHTDYVFGSWAASPNRLRGR